MNQTESTGGRFSFRLICSQGKADSNWKLYSTEPSDRIVFIAWVTKNPRKCQMVLLVTTCSDTDKEIIVHHERNDVSCYVHMQLVRLEVS